MKSIIAACGNDCSVCPRRLPKTDAELTATAQLWYKIGYRDQVVSNDEISCRGCTPDTWCRHEIDTCMASRKIKNCGECGVYPCTKILAAFENTQCHRPDCQKFCTETEFAIMQKAFFEKQINLEKVRNVGSDDLFNLACLEKINLRKQVIPDIKEVFQERCVEMLACEMIIMV